MSQTNDYRVCFVGDSYVLGAGDPLCMGWVGRLAIEAKKTGYNLTHHNLGVRHDTSRNIVARWEKECAHRLPSGTMPYVVFSFGVNDTMIENDRPRLLFDESCEHMKTITSTSLSRYQTAFVGPPPVGDSTHNQRIQELSNAFMGIADNLHVPYLSLFDALQSDSSWMSELSQGDGYHPGEYGYTKISQIISGWSKWWFYTLTCS